MSTEPAKEYTFSTLQELVDVVPGDKIHECMEELGVVFSNAKMLTEMALVLAKDMAANSGEPVPDSVTASIKLPPTITWIDDGKRTLGAKLVDENGKEALSFIVKGDTGKAEIK